MGACLGKGKTDAAPDNGSTEMRATKLLIIGAANVGKTSILNRFVNGKYPVEAEVTLTEGPVPRELTMPDGNKIMLHLIDTGGQEKFRTLTSSHYRGCAGVVVVFDLNDLSSFQSLENWFSEADRYSQAPIVLVGNKKDLDDAGRIAKPEEIEKTCHPYVECSALTGEGIEDIFVTMVKEIVDRSQAHAM